MTTVRALTLARALPLFAIALALTGAARGDEPLRWKFTKGRTIHYKMTQKTTTKIEANGQKLDTSLSQDIDMTWAVTAVDGNGNAEMDQTLDRIVFTMSGPAGQVSIDTSKPAGDETGPAAAVGKLFYGLVGKPFHMKMSARGDITDVVVPAKVLESLKDAGPAAAGNPLLSEDGLKRMVSQASLVLPEAAMTKGHTWKANKSFPLPPIGTIVVDSDYTYEGPDGPIERIGVDFKTQIKPADDSALEVKILSQDNKGKFRFDREGGFLRGSEQSQKMTMQITVGGMEIGQDIESTTKMEEVKAETSK